MPIRPATEQDLPAILAITNHAILHTTASWQTKPHTLAMRAAWLAERQTSGLPVLVAEVDGEVAGYGSYGSFRAYEGYALTVEHSIYIEERFQRRGLGQALLAALIDHATAAGMHVMVAVISAENTVSIALHARFGFAVTGRLPEVGRKFDRWLDLVLMQRLLQLPASQADCSPRAAASIDAKPSNSG